MDIEELFKSYSNKKVFVLLNQGNRGDGLIHEGGRNLLRKNHVDFEEIRFPQDISGETLFVYGCGAFSKYYHHMIEQVNFYSSRFKEIVILPSSFEVTCEEVKVFISNLPENIIIYCREYYSYRQVLDVVSLKLKKNILLNKDMAFYFDYFKWNKKGKGVFMVFRQDGEANKKRNVMETLSYVLLTLKLNIWHSKVDKFDASDGKEDEWELLLETLMNYDTIYTDRAHVAIAGTLMGKKVHVYPSVYHKQKGIFEYSLADFPNARWK